MHIWKTANKVIQVQVGYLIQRTCIGCRSVKDKHDMLRLYRSSDGEVCVDLKGNKPGRGAYLCSYDCFEKSEERNLISRSLRVKFMNNFGGVEKAAINGFFSNRRGCEE